MSYILVEIYSKLNSLIVRGGGYGIEYLQTYESTLQNKK